MPRNPRNPGQVHGARHPAAKLSEAIVRELRRRVRGVKYPGGFVLRAAEKHGVAPSAISNAIHGVTWSHVPGAVSARFHYSPRGPRGPRRRPGLQSTP